jgi:hypothetical protein
MLSLVRELPELVVYLISGERAGALEAALLQLTGAVGGTLIRWQDEL